jgi:hypothetical protein
MPQWANTSPFPEYDGVLYCLNAILPGAEGDLSATLGQTAYPDPVLYGQAFFATVVLTALGPISSNTSYVVAQCDCGDGVWVDIAWLTWTGTAGNATFCLTGGSFTANSLTTRTAGTAPSPPAGSNQCPLGGRLRFVGKAIVNGSSGTGQPSSPSGQAPSVACAIKVKLLGL